MLSCSLALLPVADLPPRRCRAPARHTYMDEALPLGLRLAPRRGCHPQPATGPGLPSRSPANIHRAALHSLRFLGVLGSVRFPPTPHPTCSRYPISSQVAAESLPVRREPGWRGSTRRNDCGQPFASSRESERPGRQGGASPARLGAGPGAESGAETVARDNAGASQQTVSWADGGLLLRTQTWPLDTSTEQTFLED